jgi:hypothetical protein
MNSLRFRLGMKMIGMAGERWIAAVNFQETNKNEVNTRYMIIESVEYIK